MAPIFTRQRMVYSDYGMPRNLNRIWKLAASQREGFMDPRLDKLRGSLESAVAGMSSDQWTWHLPGKWCAAELLEHLYLTYTGTIKGFERVVATGKPLGSRPFVRDRVKTLVVVGLSHMPGGVQAPAVTVPKGLPAAQVREEFGAKIVEMDAIITQCEARFGARVHVLDHPSWAH